MRRHKLISTILHPIVMPTIGVLLYFILKTTNFNTTQYALFLAIVFIATYVIPILLLLFLKLIGKINSFEVHSIEERKIPLFVMVCIFLVLGKFFQQFNSIRELSYLFYGTLISMIVVYFIFLTKVKTSLHLLSMGSAFGYFIILHWIINISILPILVIFMLLSGLLASSRLHLKVHTPKEVYLGFIIGLMGQLLVYYML